MTAASVHAGKHLLLLSQHIYFGICGQHKWPVCKDFIKEFMEVAVRTLKINSMLQIHWSKLLREG